jgi:hypothetical protein
MRKEFAVIQSQNKQFDSFCNQGKIFLRHQILNTNHLIFFLGAKMFRLNNINQKAWQGSNITIPDNKENDFLLVLPKLW